MKSSHTLFTSIKVEVVGNAVLETASAIVQEKEWFLARNASLIIDFRTSRNDTLSLFKDKWRST